MRTTAEITVYRHRRGWRAAVLSVGLTATESGSMYRVRADTKAEALRLATVWAQEYADEWNTKSANHHTVELVEATS